MVLVSYSGREINAKLVYYGPGLSGKTTNLEFIYGSIPQGQRGKMVSMKTKTERTLFFDFLPVHLGELSGFKTRFLLYTVPGQVYYNATRKLVLKGVDAVVFVADSKRGKMDENVESLENLKENLKELGLTLDKLPWVIQYNKRDLSDIYSLDELEAVLNPDRVPAYEGVASTGAGVVETFKGVSRLLLRKLAKDVGVPVVGSTVESGAPAATAASAAMAPAPSASGYGAAPAAATPSATSASFATPAPLESPARVATPAAFAAQETPVDSWTTAPVMNAPTAFLASTPANPPARLPASAPAGAPANAHLHSVSEHFGPAIVVVQPEPHRPAPMPPESPASPADSWGAAPIPPPQERITTATASPNSTANRDSAVRPFRIQAEPMAMDDEAMSGSEPQKPAGSGWNLPPVAEPVRITGAESAPTPAQAMAESAGEPDAEAPIEQHVSVGERLRRWLSRAPDMPGAVHELPVGAHLPAEPEVRTSAAVAKEVADAAPVQPVAMVKEAAGAGTAAPMTVAPHAAEVEPPKPTTMASEATDTGRPAPVTFMRQTVETETCRPAAVEEQPVGIVADAPAAFAREPIASAAAVPAEVIREATAPFTPVQPERPKAEPAMEPEVPLHPAPDSLLHNHVIHAVPPTPRAAAPRRRPREIVVPIELNPEDLSAGVVLKLAIRMHQAADDDEEELEQFAA